MNRLTAACITLILAVPAIAAEPIVVTDLLRVRGASSIDVSRDASRAVVAVTSIGETPLSDARDDPDRPLADRRFVNQSHLFLLDLSERPRQPRQLTRGDRFDHQPAISPDGTRVAFVRGRRDGSDSQSRSEDPPQVWVMPLDGGESWQVTDLSDGAASPQWSPDGSSLLVSGAVDIADMQGVPPFPQERPNRRWGDAVADGRVMARPDGSREGMRAWLEQNAQREDPVVTSRLAFQDEQSLKGPMKLTQLWLVDPDAGPSSLRRISRGFHDYRHARFLPDGESIVYAAVSDDGRHPDRVLDWSLWRLSIDGSEDAEFLALPGWRLESPKPSQDGSVIAFTGQQMDEPMYRQKRLGLTTIAPAGGSEPAWLTDEETFDASVRNVEWLPARSSLLFTTARRGAFPLLHVSFGLLEPAAIIEESDDLPVGVHAFDAAANSIVYSMTSVENPCVLRIRDARGDRLLLDLNEWVAEKELSMPVSGWITRPDGSQVQYWLMEPVRREPGEKYPLAVEIHGGPSAMWGPGEFTMWHEFQLLCSWGYGLLYANPRGSGGYGYAFQKANHQDWSFGPASDVLAVVDQVLLKEWIDPQRLVLTGGSYGGYLTAFVVSQDHRFKAAVAQRGVYEFDTFFGEGNAWRLVEWAMGGWPWQPLIRPVLQRESPFSYVSRIRTPLLILHASEDLRTGVTQSEMLYRALKQMERPVEYVRYPGAGHDLSRTGDPMQRLDRLVRIIEFFERHISNERPAPLASDSPW